MLSEYVHSTLKIGRKYTTLKVRFGSLMFRSQCSPMAMYIAHCSLIDRSWFARGMLMVRSRFAHGSLAVRRKFALSMVEVTYSTATF